MCDTSKGNGEPPIKLNTSEVEYKESNGFTFTNYEKVIGDIKCINDGIHAECYLKSDYIPSISGGDLDGVYNFYSMHFHIGCKDDVGSVHHVDDKSYSGELHIVHYKNTFNNLSEAISSGERGAVAIMAILLQVNETTPNNPIYNEFKYILADIFTYGEEKTFELNYPLSSFLSSNISTFYRYNGFVIESGCHEVIVWTVFKEPSFMTHSQIQPFIYMEDSNGKSICDNHKAQPLNVKAAIGVYSI